MELQGSEILISHTFQRKRYISIARTGNFITYVLGPFAWNQPKFDFWREHRFGLYNSSSDKKTVRWQRMVPNVMNMGDAFPWL